jgi:hypothetical protein
VVTRDFIDSVPTGRSFQNLGVLIPGVTGGQVVGSPVNQDVGGSSGVSSMTLAIHGGRQTDQRIDLDGMSTSAWTRPDSSAIVFTDGNKLDQMWNVNPTFGGPIKKDKRWFFATYTYSRTDQLVGDSYLNSNPRGSAVQPAA